MATLESSWGAYIIALNKWNDDLQARKHAELQEELERLRQRPWWKKIFSNNAEMWATIGYEVSLSRQWKEATVEDCLTWLANKKKFL